MPREQRIPPRLRIVGFVEATIRFLHEDGDRLRRGEGGRRDRGDVEAMQVGRDACGQGERGAYGGRFALVAADVNQKVERGHGRSPETITAPS